MGTTATEDPPPDDWLGDFLYVAHAKHGDISWVKIGRTTKPRDRMANIQNGCPMPIVAMHVAKIDDPLTLSWAESAIHAALHKSRTSGEWFRLEFAPDLLRLIEGVCATFIPTMDWREIRKANVVDDCGDRARIASEAAAAKAAAQIMIRRTNGEVRRDQERVPLAKYLECYRS